MRQLTRPFSAANRQPKQPGADRLMFWWISFFVGGLGHRRRLAGVIGLALLFPASALAQFGPSDWSEPVIIDLNNPAQVDQPPQLNPSEPPQNGAENVIQDPSQLGVDAADIQTALSRGEVDALNRRVTESIIGVRVTVRQDPLLWPSEVTIDGVATLIDRGDGTSVWLTAFYLVDAAERVEFVTARGTVEATVQADARYGLAMLTPVDRLLSNARPIGVYVVSAGDEVEVFGANTGQVGSILGSGEDQYSYYQINSLGVTLGHPIINRRGEVIGIGSHRYPPNPLFTLSVPSSAIGPFLSVRD